MITQLTGCQLWADGAWLAMSMSLASAARATG
jgi:hypothetical protein